MLRNSRSLVLTSSDWGLSNDNFNIALCLSFLFSDICHILPLPLPCPLHSTPPRLPCRPPRSSLHPFMRGQGRTRMGVARRSVSSATRRWFPIRPSLRSPNTAHPSRARTEELSSSDIVGRSRRAKKGSKLSNCPLKPRARFSAIREAHPARRFIRLVVPPEIGRRVDVRRELDSSPSTTAESCESATASD